MNDDTTTIKSTLPALYADELQAARSARDEAAAVYLLTKSWPDREAYFAALNKADDIEKAYRLGGDLMRSREF